MRPRRVRRLIALSACAAVLTGTGVGWGIGEAHASPETEFLYDLNNAGIVVYDTAAALNTGYAICSALNTTTGDVVAENLYQVTSSEIPNRTTALAWVLAAGLNLCPWHDHRNAQPGFVA